MKKITNIDLDRLMDSQQIRQILSHRFRRIDLADWVDRIG